MASSSDGNERLSENTTTNTNTTTVTLNAPTSNLTPFVLSSDQAATQPQIIATPKGGFTASDLKMLIGGGSGLTDEGQIKTGLKSTASSKINLQHLPLNTTSIVKTTTTPNLASPVSNTNISNIYNLMLNQQQQQSIVGLNMNTGGVAAGAKPATILSQPNLPIVTTSFMPNLNGNGGNNGGGNNGGKTGNGSSNSKIVISNNGSGANPRIITTTTTSTEGVNLPRSMPSSLKSSITTTSPNPGLNLKAMSPLSFDPNKNKSNNTPANKPMPTQTQTIQLINNIVNFPPGPTPAQMMSSLQQQQTQQIKNALHNKQMQSPNHLIIPQIINQMSQQQPAGNPQQPAAAIRMIDTNIAAASAAAAAAAAAAFMNNANIMNNLNEIQQQHNVVGVSPSSSPLKPNIIRKSRKDSPSHTTLNLASLTGGATSNNNSNNNSSDQIFTLTQQHHTNLQNQIFHSTLASNKHSIFELNQESIKTLAQSVSNNSLPVSLANALVGINNQTLSAMTAAIAQNQAQSNQTATNTTPATLTYSLAPSNVLNPSEMNKGESKPSSEEHNEANNDDRASTSSSPSSKTTSTRKKRKQEFKILDFNVGFSENPLAVKRPHMNDYSSSSPVNNAATSGSSAKVHVSSFTEKLNKHGYDNHQYSRRDIEQENAAESELKKQQQQKMSTTSSKQQTQSLKPPQQHVMKIDANNSSKLVNNFAIPSTPVTLISEPPTIVGSSHQDSTVSVKTEIEEEEEQEEDDDDSFSEGFLDDETVKLLSKDFCYITSDGVKWVSKRPRHSLSTAGSGRSAQQCPHVCKYSEISNSSSKFANPSKTVTLDEFEKNLNHWKLFYLTSQINNHIEYENESMNLINEIDQLVQQINIDGHNDLADITFKVNESIKANNQRHKSVNEQLDESRLLLSKLIGHKNAYKNEVARPKKSSSNIRKSSSSSSASSSTLSLNSISNSNALSTKLGGRKSTSTSSMLNKIHRLKK